MQFHKEKYFIVWFTLILYRMFVLNITRYLGRSLIRNTHKGGLLANYEFVFIADIY